MAGLAGLAERRRPRARTRRWAGELVAASTGLLLLLFALGTTWFSSSSFSVAQRSGGDTRPPRSSISTWVDEVDSSYDARRGGDQEGDEGESDEEGEDEEQARSSGVWSDNHLRAPPAVGDSASDPIRFQLGNSFAKYRLQLDDALQRAQGQKEVFLVTDFDEKAVTFALDTALKAFRWPVQYSTYSGKRLAFQANPLDDGTIELRFTACRLEADERSDEPLLLMDRGVDEIARRIGQGQRVKVAGKSGEGDALLSAIKAVADRERLSSEVLIMMPFLKLFVCGGVSFEVVGIEVGSAR
mmetsp:Transcript_76055/g.217872  ORF Transcript_76055/g.217872 Transcript_76055/m.217872 type:complete len:299 (-) Transcript_76055:77-973(-)